ncbi:MAG: hypothetical protein P1V81_05100, partial [Planctomycetota bacterium]|nr:hypothetical protein [Planctomycetota bacterium]
MNGGSLALFEGVLYWGLNSGAGAGVRAHDLNGHPLDVELGPGPGDSRGSSVSGLAVDPDRRLWMADTLGRCVRGYSLFGREGGRFEPETGALEAPAARYVDGPVDLVVAPGDTWRGLWVATGGERRAAVGLHLPDGTRLATLRSEGDPKRAFRRITRLAARGEELWVLESGARRVQVFRRGDFHFLFGLPEAVRRGRSWPRALWPLSDGRLVLAVDDGGGEARGAAVRRLDQGGHVSGPVDLVVEETELDRRS